MTQQAPHCGNSRQVRSECSESGESPWPHPQHFLESGDSCAILQPMHPRKPYEPPKLKKFGDLNQMIRTNPGSAGQQPQSLVSPGTDLF